MPISFNEIWDAHMHTGKTIKTTGTGIGVTGLCLGIASYFLTAGLNTPYLLAAVASTGAGASSSKVVYDYSHEQCVRYERTVESFINNIRNIIEICLNDIKGNLTSTQIIKSQFNLKVQEIKDVCRNKVLANNTCEEKKRDKINKETEINDLENNITSSNNNITRINAEIRILNDQKENIEAQSYNENPDTLWGGSRADVRNENLNNNDDYNNIILNINNKLTEIMNLENEISTFNRSIIEKRGELRILDRDYNTLLEEKRIIEENPNNNIDNKYDELEEIKDRLLNRLNASTIIRN
jgi:hypothetical protein